MKILVFSDSHSSLSFMRRCVSWQKPDVIIHLGDHYDDGAVIAEENPNVIVHQVPGNCDRYRCPLDAKEILSYPVCGVLLYMTHGHRHGVKTNIYKLLADAREKQVQAVLYGHTHVADCHQESDGLWVLNPGSCGHYGGSAGVIEAESGKIIACRIIRQADMD